MNESEFLFIDFQIAIKPRAVANAYHLVHTENCDQSAYKVYVFSEWLLLLPTVLKHFWWLDSFVKHNILWSP